MKKKGMATTRAYAGVEHDDRLDSNNPILSPMTQKRTPSLRSVIQPHGLRENIVQICTLNMERKVVKAQIDSASTCNTIIPSFLPRKLFLTEKLVELEAR